MPNYKTLTLRKEDRQDPPRSIEQVKDLFALYSAGQPLMTRISRFFNPAKLEPKTVYLSKLDEAKTCYIDHFATVIDFYVSYLFSHPMTVGTAGGGVPPEFYSTLKENADGNGTDLHVMMAGAFRSALIGKVAAFSVALPETEAVPRNLAEFEAMHAGDAKVKLWEAEQVLDYEFQEDGSLAWLTLHRSGSKRVSPLQEPVRVETVTLLDTEAATVFTWVTEKAQPQGDAEPSSVVRSEHGYGFVPAVLLDLGDRALGDKLEPPAHGFWKAVAKKCWLTNTHAHSKPYIESKDPDGVNEAVENPGTVLSLPEGSKVGFWHPPSESFEALDSEAEFFRSEIFRVGNLSSIAEKSSSMPWRSAASKMVDVEAGQVSIRAYGAKMREVQETLLNLIARMRGEDVILRTSGFEHLETEDLATLTNKDLQATVKGIPSPTFQTEFQKRIVSQALKDLDESVKATIFEEIQEANEKEPEPVQAAPVVLEAVPNPEDQGAIQPQELPKAS